MTLKDAGFDVLEACDGQDALDQLATHKVNLIVSDVNMPRMGGFSFLEKVRQNSLHKFTPVVMLTTETGTNKQTAGRLLGAKAWVTKPFKPEQLLRAVSKFLPPE